MYSFGIIQEVFGRTRLEFEKSAQAKECYQYRSGVRILEKRIEHSGQKVERFGAFRTLMRKSHSLFQKYVLENRVYLVSNKTVARTSIFGRKHYCERFLFQFLQ